MNEILPRKKKEYKGESMPHMLVIMVTHLPMKGLGVYRTRVNKGQGKQR